MGGLNHLNGLSSDLLFDTLYRKYFRRIYNYAYMRLLNREAAEDAAQEVFLAALTHIESFDLSRSDGAAWLSKIAANIVTDLQKRARNYREISVGDVPETAVEDNFDDEGTLKNPVNRRAARILQKLTDDERNFLALRYEMELTNEEIAASMGISVNAVSHRYSRLLEKCRQIDDDA
mgnify:CR=1 FL=1